MRSKRRRRRRRRSRRAGQNKNNPLEKAWDGKGYSNTTHPKAFARDLPIKLGPLARRRGMNNDNRVALTLNPRSRRTKDLSNLAYYNITRKERKAREKKSGGNRRRRRRRRSRRRRRGGKSPAPGSKSKGPVMREYYRVQPGYVLPVTRSQTKKARSSYKKVHARHAAAAARMGLEDKRGSSAPTAMESTSAVGFRLPRPAPVGRRRPSKAPKAWTPPKKPASKGGRRRRSRRRRKRGGAGKCWKCGKDVTAEQQCPSCGARWPGSSKGGDVGGGWFQKWSNKKNRAYYYHERDPKTPYWEKPQQDAGGGAGGAAASNAYSDVEWSDDGSRPSNIQGTAAQYRRSPKYTSVADGPKGREDRKKPDKYDPNKGGRRRRSRRRRRQSGGAPTCKKCGSDLQCPRCDGGGGNGGSGAAANESRIKENEARIKENEAYIKKKDKEIEDLIAGSAAELEDF